MSGDEARRRQKLSIETQRAKREAGVDAKAKRLLADWGISWEEADESLRVLALDAVAGKGGSVTAHRLLLDRLGKLKTASPDFDPEKGPCPTCGGQTLVISMSVDDYRQFQESIQEE